MELNRKNIKRIILIIIFTILFYACVQNFSAIYGALKQVYSVFATVIAGLCIAFVLNVILRIVEEKIFVFMRRSKKPLLRKMQRPVSMVVTLLIAVGIIAVILLVVIPEVYDTLVMLFNNVPMYLNDAVNWFEGIAEKMNFAAERIPALSIDWNTTIAAFSEYMKNASGTILNTATSVTTSVVNGVISIAFSLIIAVYVLAQKEKISKFVKRALFAYFPDKIASNVIRISKMSSESFSNFIRGQVVDCTILAILCFIGMNIFRFPYAAVISVFIGFTALVPMVGSFVGVVVGALLILFVSPLKALLFVVMVLVIQQIDGTIIYPKVVGKSVGLPGVIVVSAVLIGGKISGVAGALVATPIGAVVYALVKESIAKRLKNKENARQQNVKEEIGSADFTDTETPAVKSDNECCPKDGLIETEKYSVKKDEEKNDG